MAEDRFGFKNSTFAYGNNTPIIEEANLQFGRTDRITVLVPQGSGKSTLLDLIRGQSALLSGSIKIPINVSWPIGASGFLHPSLTGEENIRSLSRISGNDPVEIANWVAEFSELGDRFFEKVGVYSSGERARLAYTFSYAIPSSFYVGEDSLETGEMEFATKCSAVMNERLEDSGLFLVTRNTRIAKAYGTRYFVLINAKFVECDTGDVAAEVFENLLKDNARRLDLGLSPNEVG